MGFGSYDESEQENQEVDVDDDSSSVDKGSEYEGDEEFKFGEADTDDLLDQLEEIKDDEE